MSKQELSSRNKLRKEEKCCGDCCWFKLEDIYGDGTCAKIFAEITNCSDKCHKSELFFSKEQAKRYLHVLTEHNKWRRDDNVPNSLPMQDPKEIGLAIDFAVEYIKTFMEL
jgi:hypothetical protein